METKTASAKKEQKIDSIQDNTGKPPPINNALVKAVEILDVYDKKLKYIVIENEWGKVIISVGEKTFNNIKELTR